MAAQMVHSTPIMRSSPGPSLRLSVIRPPFKQGCVYVEHTMFGGYGTNFVYEDVQLS